MSPIEGFLQAVENKLRGPAKLRPEVIEELRGHLADRIEALVQQEYGPEEAEVQAMEEMGSAWLLAMRLSLANGWYLFPEILRELGALGLSLVMMLLAAQQLSFIGRIADPNVPGLANPWAAAAVAVVSCYLISLAALAVFAFYLARLRQSRIWAILPAYLMFINFPDFYYLTGVIFVIAVSLGAIKPSPRKIWPLLAAAGMVILAGIGIDLAVNVIGYHLPISLKMAANYFYWSPFNPFYNYQFWGFLWASCFFWLAAWILERVHAPSITEASE